MHLQHVRFGEAHRCDSAVTRSFGRHARYDQQANRPCAPVGGICEEGDHILDPFAGADTTLVAADLEGYQWTGIEMTGHYLDVAQGRLPPA